ncbi:MAG: hypothetical protein EOL86_14820, partial [Deltaproteobacteria bacterium]|nr:hypothetical protein [Deltaproteobacteria bacterium]
MAQLFGNNASGKLAAAVDIDDTTIVLESGQGARFPTLDPGDYFVATLAGIVDGREVEWEIVKVVARVSDTLTIVRAQEGSPAKPWPPETIFEQRITAGIVADLYTQASAPALSSPGPIYVTQTKTISVTNYDGFSIYAVSATSGAASISGDAITYTAPATSGADALTVTVNGSARDVALDILPASVVAPTITTPVANAEIGPTNVTIATSAFATVGQSDMHLKSRYVIKDSGGTTVYDSGESDSLTSIVVASPGLTRGAAYTITAQHQGQTLGWSDWSAPVAVTISTIGRGARIDDKATVIGNADGTPFTINGQQVWIAVLDAAY